MFTSTLPSVASWATASWRLRRNIQGTGAEWGRIVADTSPPKRVTVVDADVDIRDPLHVEWALNSRFITPKLVARADRVIE
jgi:UbiD family decarboxylase